MKFVPDLQHPLFLISTKMPTEGELVITVRLASGYEDPASPIGRKGWDILSYPSIVKPTLCYQLHFFEFITYCVTDESQYAGDSTAEGEGIMFRRFSKSKFLDFVGSMTYENTCSSTKFHYGIYCLNACIDVVAMQAPIISLLGNSAGEMI